jgi:CelD/BcsL family acetyltransferase involved in cellulose biosynthesis
MKTARRIARRAPSPDHDRSMNKELANTAVPLRASSADSGVAAPRPLSVRLLTGEAEFAALAPDWNRLHAVTDAASVFNSWVWQFNWWKLYGGGQPLRILVARDGEEVVGILALYVQTVRVFGARVRILRLVGTEGDTHPDDLGPVLAPGAETQAALALARAALRLPLADVLLFSDIHTQSPFPQAAERAAGAEGLHGAMGASERIVFAALPPSWSEFLAALTSDRRTRIRSARRKLLAAHPEARFFVWEDVAGIDAAVDRLAELHRRRWQAAGGSESFATREYVEFHRAIIRSFLTRGWLRLYCLEVGGAVVAMSYCYRMRNRVFLMQAGFEPALARFRPGAVLLGYAIEHAIAEGNEVFDFLRGEHRYKSELANGRRDTAFVQIFRRTPAALLYRAREVQWPALKARLHGLAGRFATAPGGN